MLISKQIDESEIYQNKVKRIQPGQRYFVSTKQYINVGSEAMKKVWVEVKFKQVTGKDQKVLWFTRKYESSTHEIHEAIFTINTLDYLLDDCQILTAKEFYEMKEKFENDIEKIIYDIKGETNERTKG